MREATKTGLAPQEYRDEVRRQILEGKLLQLRVRSRVRVTDEDIKSTYSRLQLAERARLNYRPGLGRPTGPSRFDPYAVAKIVKISVHASQPPREPESTAAATGSSLPTWRAAFGSHPHPLRRRRFGYPGPRRTRSGHRRRSSQARGRWGLPPFRYKGDIMVVKMVSRDRSQIPAFDSVRDELLQRAYGEQMDKARKQWLAEMRRGMYVDVRL